MEEYVPPAAAVIRGRGASLRNEEQQQLKRSRSPTCRKAKAIMDVYTPPRSSPKNERKQHKVRPQQSEQHLTSQEIDRGEEAEQVAQRIASELSSWLLTNNHQNNGQAKNEEDPPLPPPHLKEIIDSSPSIKNHHHHHHHRGGKKSPSSPTKKLDDNERSKSGISEGWTIEFRLKELENEIKRLRLNKTESSVGRCSSPTGNSETFSIEEHVMQRLTHVEGKVNDINKDKAKSSVFNPCKCFVKSQDKGTISSVRLNKNIWTAAFISPLVESDPSIRWQLVLPQYLGLFITILAQISFILFVAKWSIYTDHTSCARGSGVMRTLCTCVVFSVVATSDFNDLSNFRRWLRYVPRWTERGHRQLADEHQTYLAVLRIQNGEEEVYALATGITNFYFYFSYWFLTVPRPVLAVFNLGFAAGYILYSDTNEEIILHTLASLLIIQIGSYAYDYLTGQPVKDVLEGLPPLGLLASFDKEYDEHLTASKKLEKEDVNRAIQAGYSTVAFETNDDGNEDEDVLTEFGYQFYAFKDDKNLQNIDGLVLLPLMIVTVLILYSSWCWDRDITLYVTLAFASFGAFLFACSSIISKFQSKPIDALSYLDLNVAGKIYTTNYQKEQVSVPVPSWYTFLTGKRFEDGHTYDPDPIGTKKRLHLEKIQRRDQKKRKKYEKKQDRMHKKYFDNNDRFFDVSIF